MRRPRLSTILMGTGAALALIAGGTAAGAAIAGPVDGNGVIHGCYYKPDQSGSSQLVLQDSTTTCAKNTTSITWNQTGPQGPKGETGASGPAGTGATVSSLATGDGNCPNGGAQVADGNSPPDVAYACNGATGAQGPPGPAGTNGTNGVSGYQVVNDGIQTLSELSGRDFYVDCPAGKQAVGGGLISGGSITIDSSAPSQANDPTNHPNGWFMHLFDNSALGTDFFTVYAICVDAS